jgi:hypothetical protein
MCLVPLVFIAGAEARMPEYINGTACLSPWLIVASGNGSLALQGLAMFIAELLFAAVLIAIKARSRSHHG